MIECDVGAKPKRKDVSEWIYEAWRTIPATMVQNTWRHIGYTTSGIDCTVLGSTSSGEEESTDDEFEEPEDDPLALNVDLIQELYEPEADNEE